MTGRGGPLTDCDTIWKYPLPIQDEFTIRMKAGAVPLSVQIQNGEPTLWAAVNSQAEDEQHRFSIRGTGHPLDIARHDSFIGTFQLERIGLVFHLFDCGPEEVRR